MRDSDYVVNVYNGGGNGAASAAVGGGDLFGFPGEIRAATTANGSWPHPPSYGASSNGEASSGYNQYFVWSGGGTPTTSFHVAVSGTASGSATYPSNGTASASSLFDGAGFTLATSSQSANASVPVSGGASSTFLHVYVESYSTGGGYGSPSGAYNAQATATMTFSQPTP